MHLTARFLFTTTGFICMLILAPACSTVPDLPDALDVATTDADRVSAPKDTGPTDLANTTWSIMRVTDSDEENGDGEGRPPGPYGGLLNGQALQRPPVGERIFLVEFGPAGEMIHVRENRFFLPAIYGDEVPVGADWSNATIPGMFFRSASYGVQIGDRFGIAVVVQVRYLQAFLGRAVLYAWGTIDEDTIDGQFGYLLDFSEGAVPFLPTVADQYPVAWERVEE